MIRELLQTVGNPDVFFNHGMGMLFYNENVVTDEQFIDLVHTECHNVFMDKLSYGQTRDFINAVADELGEPL